MRATMVSVLLPLILCAGCAKYDTPPSVVLITIDTLRADHLGCYGYFRDTSPVIDALAGEGVLFENVVVPMSTTLPSHTSLFTSSYPVRHGVLANFDDFRQPVPVDEDDFQTAAQMFLRAGYHTAAFTSIYHLGPASGIAAGFESFDTVEGTRGDQPLEIIERRSDVTTDRVLAWLDSAVDEPFFLWVHYFDPHAPYDPPAGLRDRYPIEQALSEWLAERAIPRYREVGRIHNLYDAEIRFNDRQIGRLFERLKEKGLYDRALIVLTADHGEGLYQHDEPEHGVLFEEQIRAPLIFRFPAGAGPAPRRIPALASSIDVLPTIVRAVGLPVSGAQFDGIDLFDGSRRFALAQREHSIRRYGNGVHFTLADARFKYHYHSDGNDALFDLDADPHETASVIADHPAVAEAMRAELMRQVQRNRERGAGLEKRPLPADLERALRALGYAR